MPAWTSVAVAASCLGERVDVGVVAALREELVELAVEVEVDDRLGGDCLDNGHCGVTGRDRVEGAACADADAAEGELQHGVMVARVGRDHREGVDEDARRLELVRHGVERAGGGVARGSSAHAMRPLKTASAASVFSGGDWTTSLSSRRLVSAGSPENACCSTSVSEP